PPTVNEETRKIYICPFTGRVFADNTHPNPQDAIYDWVSKCPENKERVGGLPIKRFFVSEDLGIIKKYIFPRKKAVTKIVYSSVINSKLYNSKKAIIDDFTANYLKPWSLHEVQNQNRFELSQNLLAFVQEHLQEARLTAFVETMSEFEEFMPYVNQWIEEEEEEEGEE
ncbi:DUF2709 domain-containing protein, partial [Simkania negevensis]|nr:DUF2709 domain-containing protein [Simkania negevensis]